MIIGLVKGHVVSSAKVEYLEEKIVGSGNFIAYSGWFRAYRPAHGVH